MNVKEALEIIYNNFGVEVQKKKLEEEIIELLNESYHSSTNSQKYISEMVDVFIIISQFMLYKDNKWKKTFNKIYKEKLKRTVDRIENGYY